VKYLKPRLTEFELVSRTERRNGLVEIILFSAVVLMLILAGAHFLLKK
jgi:hypothetical protein